MNPKIKALYKNPDNLTLIEFANNTDIKKYIWVEPTCIEIELDIQTEYQIVTHDRTFRIEFGYERITFWLQYSFGFVLNKRPRATEVPNPNQWTLEMDWSDIN